MAPNNRESIMPPSGPRAQAQKEGRDFDAAVTDRAMRSKNTARPPYKILELIGKGSYGRVYKARRHNTYEYVAVKVIDVDASDLQEAFSRRSVAMNDIITEVLTLRTLRESGAVNINLVYDAFPFASEIWIVSEYCPGGSLHTLLKATPTPGLAERHIIPVARELAIALKGVHAAGYLHRDVKAANVLITQDGQLQLCDFGVSAVVSTVSQDTKSKRETIIGTPNWMAPELLQSEGASVSGGYGAEVDCWAYGCTIFELASGFPPNATVHPDALGEVLQEPPRLEGDDYSDELKDFVATILNTVPSARPDAAQILEHPFVANTAEDYPTSALKELIQGFSSWESKGGVRTSLFNPFGAAGPAPFAEQDDGWNFAEEASMDPEDWVEDGGDFRDDTLSSSTKALYLTDWDRQRAEQKASRASKNLGKIFTEDADEEYHYAEAAPSFNVPPPPRRNHSEEIQTARDSMVEDEIDIDALMAGGNTLRPSQTGVSAFTSQGDAEDEDYDYDDTPTWNPEENRKTREWTFPTAQANPSRKTVEWQFPTASDNVGTASSTAPARSSPNRRTVEWKFPSRQPSNEIIDLDLGPPTAISSSVTSTEWDFNSENGTPLNETPPSNDGPRRETMQWKWPSAQDDSPTIPESLTAPTEHKLRPPAFKFPPREDLPAMMPEPETPIYESAPEPDLEPLATPELYNGAESEPELDMGTPDQGPAPLPAISLAMPSYPSYEFMSGTASADQQAVELLSMLDNLGSHVQATRTALGQDRDRRAAGGVSGYASNSRYSRNGNRASRRGIRGSGP